MILGAAGTHSLGRTHSLRAGDSRRGVDSTGSQIERGCVFCYRCDYTALADRILPTGGTLAY